MPFSLRSTGDFFRKIVVLDGNSKLWADDDGVMYVGVIPYFLVNLPLEQQYPTFLCGEWYLSYSHCF